MVEGGVPVGFDVACPAQALLEIFQIRPGIAVIGPEACEFDISEVEQASLGACFVPFHHQAAVASGMPRGVVRSHAHAAEIEDGAVGVGLGIGSRGVVEVLDQDAAKRAVDGLAVCVDGHHVVEGVESGPVEFVDMDRDLGKEREARGVVFVAMREEDPVDLGQGRRVTTESQGGIDEERLLLPRDQHGVAVGVGALALSEENPNRAALKLGLGVFR